MEGDVQPRLPVLDEKAEPLVGLLGSAEARVLAHGPGTLPVHELVDPAGEGELARSSDAALAPARGEVLRGVERLHLDARLIDERDDGIGVLLHLVLSRMKDTIDSVRLPVANTASTP